MFRSSNLESHPDLCEGAKKKVRGKFRIETGDSHHKGEVASITTKTYPNNEKNQMRVRNRRITAMGNERTEKKMLLQETPIRNCLSDQLMKKGFQTLMVKGNVPTRFKKNSWMTRSKNIKNLHILC